MYHAEKLTAFDVSLNACNTAGAAALSIDHNGVVNSFCRLISLVQS